MISKIIFQCSLEGNPPFAKAQVLKICGPRKEICLPSMKVEPNNFCPAGRSPPIIGSFRSLPHTQTFSLPFKLLLDHVKVDNNPRHHPTFHRHSVGLSSSQSSSPSSKNVLCGLKQVYHLLRHHQQQH